MHAPTPETERNSRVVHPLFDRPEEKVNVEALPPLSMTPRVRISLIALRGYLIVLMAMLVYRFLQMAGVLGPPIR